MVATRRDSKRMNAASDRDRKLKDLLRVIQQESDGLGGHGEIVVKVTFHAGVPQTVDVLDRRKRYRLGVVGDHAS